MHILVGMVHYEQLNVYCNEYGNTGVSQDTDSRRERKWVPSGRGEREREILCTLDHALSPGI